MQRKTTGIEWYGIALAVILALSIPWSLFQIYQDGHTRQNAEAADSQRQNREQIFDLCQQKPSAIPADCLAQAHQAYPEDKHSEYDLAAQQDMAEWALLAVLIGTIGTVASLGALWGLFLTLREQRAQFAAERRPWVHVSSFKFTQTPSYDPDVGWTFAYELRIENVGQSPATWVSHFVQAIHEMDPGSLLPAQKEIREALVVERSVLSTTVFPHERDVTLRDVTEIGRDKIDEARQNGYEGQPRNEWPAHMSLYPAFVGAIRYEGGHGGQVFTTSFIFYLTDDADDPLMGGLLMPDISKPQFLDMPAHTVVRFWKGWHAE